MLQEYTSDINLKLAFKGPYSLNILFPFFYLLVACVISKTDSVTNDRLTSYRYKLYITYLQITFIFFCPFYILLKIGVENVIELIFGFI